MPEDTGYPGRGTDPMRPGRAPPPSSKAFRANVEPRGRQRFGPPPRAERPTRQNPLNTDPMGLRRPWQKAT